jgi:hypothetical protein
MPYLHTPNHARRSEVVDAVRYVAASGEFFTIAEVMKSLGSPRFQAIARGDVQSVLDELRADGFITAHELEAGEEWYKITGDRNAFAKTLDVVVSVREFFAKFGNGPHVFEKIAAYVRNVNSDKTVRDVEEIAPVIRYMCDRGELSSKSPDGYTSAAAPVDDADEPHPFDVETDSAPTDEDAAAHEHFGTDASTVRAALIEHFAKFRAQHTAAIEVAARRCAEATTIDEIRRFAEMISLRAGALDVCIESEARARGGK